MLVPAAPFCPKLNNFHRTSENRNTAWRNARTDGIWSLCRKRLQSDGCFSRNVRKPGGSSAEEENLDSRNLQGKFHLLWKNKDFLNERAERCLPVPLGNPGNRRLMKGFTLLFLIFTQQVRSCSTAPPADAATVRIYSVILEKQRFSDVSL